MSPSPYSAISETHVDEFPFKGGSFTNISRCSLGRASRHDSSCIVVKTWRVRPTSHDDSEGFSRTLYERLEQWSRLLHPNIATFIGVMSTRQGPPSLLMPLFTQGNAKDYLTKYSSTDILRLLCDVAAGLSYMHSRDPPLAHGTLKASNILITDEGVARISDPFINMLPVPPFWTIDSAVYARWLAPEIISNDDEGEPLLASTAADVHSFGMTALELYTGHRPFSHLRSRVAVILSLMKGGRPLRPTAEEAPRLTDPLWAIIQHCWKQDPTKRPSAEIVYAWLNLVASHQ